jgi:hypothetical protein
MEVKGELLEQVGDFTFALIASWFGYGFIGDRADHCELHLDTIFAGKGTIDVIKSKGATSTDLNF